jgi:hypothetical protein
VVWVKYVGGRESGIRRKVPFRARPCGRCKNGDFIYTPEYYVTKCHTIRKALYLPTIHIPQAHLHHNGRGYIGARRYESAVLA